MSNFKTRGSEWRRWDLHIHTKGTNKNDNFKSLSFDEFCSTLFRSALDNNVAAIGITDYCSIENYLKVKDYQRNIYSNDEFSKEERDNIKELFLFPNVELRMLPVTGADRLINIHCLFNPEYVSMLDIDFFTELKFSTGDQSNFRMDKAGLVALGKSLTENISEEEAYRKGVGNFVLEYSQLEKLINTNKKFRENTIIAVANSNKDGVSGLQKHYDLFEGDSGDLTSKRQAIYRLSQCIFSGNPNDRLYFLGKKSDDVRTVISKLGSLKACIHGSDAHEEKKMFLPDEKRYCWIKADLSFEGLKQILYEPEQRVKIQEFQPDSKDDKLVIDEVQFISDDSHYFTPSAIKLNKNLNVIIGGKSSGKSILLYLIAKALLRKEDEFLLYKNEKTTNNLKYAFENDLKLNLHIHSGQEVSSDRDLNEASLIPEIKYIPQNYLSKLAEPEGQKTGNALRKLVRNLLLEKEDENSKYNDFISALKNDDVVRENLIDEYFIINDNIIRLHNQLSAKGNESVLKSNIEKSIKELDVLKKEAGLSPEQVERYNQLKSTLEINSTQVEKLMADFQKVNVFSAKVVSTLADLNKDMTTLRNSEINEDILEYIKPYYKDIYSAFQDAYKFAELISLTEDNHFINDNIFNQRQHSLFQEKQRAETELKPYVKNEELKEKIKALEEIVEQDKIKLASLNKIKKEIGEQNVLLDNKEKEIFNRIEFTYSRYERIIRDLRSRTSDLGEGINIFGTIKYNFPKMRKHVEDISDKRTQSYRNYQYLFDDNKSGVSDYDLKELVSVLQTVFKGIINDTYKIRDISKKVAVKALLDDYFFDNWDVNYQGDNLVKMSSGKASFVILMLIIGLSESKAPILIDQPEDNLDNRSITKDLVRFIREKKQERQIILVTHNPNIVVNADAENVIVANQEGQNDTDKSSLYQFDYINGALENTFRNNEESDLLKSMGIREHIADIVEGGEDAFKKREKKYNFKKN